MSNLQTLKRLWWLHPVPLFGGSVVLTLLVAVFFSERSFELYGTPKYLEIWHLGIGFASWGAFSLGVGLALTTGKSFPPQGREIDGLLVSWFWGAYALTLAGYLLWLIVGLKNGFSLGMLLEFLRGADETLADALKHDVFVTVPGVTTSTQFGLAAMLLGTRLYCRGKTSLKYPLGSLIFLAAARALIYSERLALIELVVPAVVLALRLKVLERPLPADWRVGIIWLPLVAVPLVAVLFGGFEYFRSWQYYKESFSSLPEFTIWRLLGYYTTAHNNGAMSLALREPWPLPYATLSWIWEFPLIESSSFSYEHLSGVNPAEIHTFTLERYGNEELNNDGGLFTPIRDFGWAGFGFFWIVFGFLVGKAYRGYRGGTLAGCLFYPIFFLAILELPRVQYFTTTRTFPAIVFLTALWLWLSWRPSIRVMEPAKGPALQETG